MHMFVLYAIIQGRLDEVKQLAKTESDVDKNEL